MDFLKAFPRELPVLLSNVGLVQEEAIHSLSHLMRVLKPPFTHFEITLMPKESNIVSIRVERPVNTK